MFRASSEVIKICRVVIALYNNHSSTYINYDHGAITYGFWAISLTRGCVDSMWHTHYKFRDYEMSLTLWHFDTLTPYSTHNSQNPFIYFRVLHPHQPERRLKALRLPLTFSAILSDVASLGIESQTSASQTFFLPSAENRWRSCMRRWKSGSCIPILTGNSNR